MLDYSTALSAGSTRQRRQRVSRGRLDGLGDRQRIATLAGAGLVPAGVSSGRCPCSPGLGSQEEAEDGGGAHQDGEEPMAATRGSP